MFNRLLLWLTQKLYPNGRAFRMPAPVEVFYSTEDLSEEYTTEDDDTLTTEAGTTGGILYRLHRAINKSFAQAWADASQVTNDLLPDNPDFTIDDAHDWYRRLGIYDSGLVTLADMKLAIAERLSFPLVPLNKQNYLYIEGQLRAAGFDVRIYENRFPDGGGGWETRSPSIVLGSPVGTAMLDTFELGESMLAGEWIYDGITLCVNYLEEAKDATFVIGANYKSTFYVAGATVTTFANVDVNRKTEFRQLLLKLKGAQTVGICFVNYV